VKITVITVCYNAQDTIEDTIKSVQAQKYKNLEYIIIDGASTDKTFEIIDKYKDVVTKLVSEPDSGVYNAMNKGINQATGDLLFFLNADDVFINELVIEQFANFAKKNPAGLLLGDVIMLDKYSGAIFNEKQPFVDNILLFKSTVFHPATFFRKEVFEKYGQFNEENKIVSDYEWFLNYFVKNNGDFAYLNKPVTLFSLGGLSSNEKWATLHEEERSMAIKRYFSAKQIKTFNFLIKHFSRKMNKIPFRKHLVKIGINRIYYKHEVDDVYTI